jgi:hypothetical protein
MLAGRQIREIDADRLKECAAMKSLFHHDPLPALRSRRGQARPASKIVRIC